MIAGTIPGHDCTHANIGHLPSGGVDAGYSTGSPEIRWTDADWRAHPDALRFCQDAGATDATADMLDVERFAATNEEAPGWYRRALVEFRGAGRPGQRHPALYSSAGNITPLVDALIRGGINGGPGLVVANWNLSDPQAIKLVVDAAGPFPIVGVQFASLEFYDVDVWDRAWVSARAGLAPFVHRTDGKESIGAIASARGMHPLAWVAWQEHLDGIAAARLVASAVPAPGETWRSIHP